MTGNLFPQHSCRGSLEQTLWRRSPLLKIVFILAQGLWRQGDRSKRRLLRLADWQMGSLVGGHVDRQGTEPRSTVSLHSWVQPPWGWKMASFQWQSAKKQKGSFGSRELGNPLAKNRATNHTLVWKTFWGMLVYPLCFSSPELEDLMSSSDWKGYIKPWISRNQNSKPATTSVVSASRATIRTQWAAAEQTPEPVLPPSFWLLCLLLTLLQLKPWPGVHRGRVFSHSVLDECSWCWAWLLMVMDICNQCPRSPTRWARLYWSRRERTSIILQVVTGFSPTSYTCPSIWTSQQSLWAEVTNWP